MAAGDSNIVEVYNAGNAPKQRNMAEDWNKMSEDYKLALSTARLVRNEELSKARDVEKNAKKQYNDALRSGDQEAIDKAKGDLDNAKTAKKQVYVAYDEAKNKAKAQRELTHDALRSAEKEHNNASADATLNFNKDLADIQKEQTEELSKQFSSGNSKSGSDNQGSDNQGSDNQGSDNQGSDNQGSDNQGSDNQGSDNQGSDNQGSDNQGSDNQGSDNQGSSDGGKDMSKGNNKKGLGLQFSQSFYDNIGNAIKGQPTGNLADVQSKGAKEQAQNLRNATATNQMEAQRAQQIANQNPYAEAGKIASMQNDAENRQNVQKAGVLGAGAALARKTNTPDVQSQIQRQDQQQSVANQRREEEQANQQEATELGNLSEQKKLESRDYTEFKDKAAALSKGEPAQPEQPKPAEQPEQPEQPGQPEPEPEPEPQPEQKPEPQTPETFNANWQNVMNYLTYGNDPTSKWSQPGGKDGGAAQKYAEAMGWQPLSESDVANASNGFDSSIGELQQIMKNKRPEFMQAWEEDSGRVKDGKQINAGDEGYEQAIQTNTQDATKDPPSDSRVKDIKKCLCDARMKWIKEDWDRDGRPSREDMIWLVNQNGLFHHNDRDYDPNDYDSWNDEDGSILGAYADNIKNYVYNYKPEATQVDPNIDPNQEHIGPMAQDIEQVNPACVKETPEGVKTVDTSRLAMMNAGAIGDLAREIQDLKARLAKLGV